MKKYKLIYGNQVLLPCGTYKECVMRREHLKKSNPFSYNLLTFKIEKI